MNPDSLHLLLVVLVLLVWAGVGFWLFECPKKPSDPKISPVVLDELRIRQLLELSRMESVAAQYEDARGDGWRYDHSQVVREYAAEIDNILERHKP